MTGIFTAAAASVSITWVLAFVPMLLILCAIAQRRFPRAGFALMALSAMSLSSWVIPVAVGLLIQSVRTLPTYHDFNIVAVFSLYGVSLPLVIACDTALIIDFLKLTRLRRGAS